MDRPAPATVPWAGSTEAADYSEGRPSGAMPRVYCARGGRPNPEGARFCSNCGSQLGAPEPPGAGIPAGPAAPGPGTGTMPARPGETTSTISLGRADDGDLADDLFPDSASFGALPPGSALLLVMRGPNAGSRFRLDGDLTTAGRHPDSDIFLDDVTVSSRHDGFFRQGAFFTVRDVGSLNGTYVNRERIEEAELFGGDEVQIGKFRLRFLTRSPEVGKGRGSGGVQGYA